MGSPSIPDPAPIQPNDPKKKKPMVFRKDAENTRDRKKLGVKNLTIPIGTGGSGASSTGKSGLGIPGSD